MLEMQCLVIKRGIRAWHLTQLYGIFSVKLGFYTEDFSRARLAYIFFVKLAQCHVCKVFCSIKFIQIRQL